MVRQSKVQLAKTYRKDGRTEEAKAVLGEYLKDADEHTLFYADALIQRGLCKCSDKEYQSAKEDYDLALSISRANNDHYVTIYNQLGISTILKDLGQVDASEDVLMEVYREAGKYGYVDLLADCLNGLSDTFVKKKEYKKAISYAQQGLEIWKHSNYYTGPAVILCTIMKALHGLGEPKEKMQDYKEELDRLMRLIKEKVLWEDYEETMELIGEEGISE